MKCNDCKKNFPSIYGFCTLCGRLLAEGKVDEYENVIRCLRCAHVDLELIRQEGTADVYNCLRCGNITKVPTVRD